MDYRQLLLFLASADRLNLSQAAEAMSITQPGLSKSMHRLQRELGTRLYYRRGRGIELTESGRALAKHARLIESQLAEARSEVIGIAAGKVGQARVGAGPSWLSRHLPDSISRVMAQGLDIHFIVDTGYPHRLIQRLRQGELDVVIGALPENRIDPDLRFSRLTSDVIKVVGRKDHPLLKKRERTLADYAAQRWVLPGQHELVRLRLARVFTQVGLPEPVIAVETDSLSLQLAMLRTSDCLAMSTMHTIALHSAQGIVLIDHSQLQLRREAGIIRRRHADMSPSIKLLIAELRKVAVKYGPT
ncbi:MAG: LysR family transcriptional regulator [Hyphomicrobiaceae bacterium]